MLITLTYSTFGKQNRWVLQNPGQIVKWFDCFKTISYFFQPVFFELVIVFHIQISYSPLRHKMAVTKSMQLKVYHHISQYS